MKHPAQREGPRPIVMLLILLCLIILVALLFAWLQLQFGDALAGDLVAEEGSIDVLFCQVDGCEARVLETLTSGEGIACAFYDLDLPDMIAALEASDADVLVFEENLGNLSFMPVDSPGLMHHKFCVLGDTVITGSMNPTRNDAYKNDNNLLIIQSPTLATRYLAEYESLAHREDGGKKRRTHPLYVNLSGTLIGLRFCPQDGCESAVVRTIDAAEEEIRFMTFSFTSDPIGEALVRADARGVSVEGVFERRQMDQWTEDDRLRDAGIPIFTDGNTATMHHKVFIIDGSVVVTGSYNPTKNGNERNDENLLVISDAGIAQEYLAEYARVRAAAATG